jgi:molecular chaperone GrpE
VADKDEASVNDPKSGLSAVQEVPPSQPVAAQQPGATGEQAEEQKAPADPLQEALAEAAANRDRWLRALADLENYKKRSLQERSNLLRYRNEELLRDLLGVVDNLDRALGHCTETGRSDAVADGVCMIANMFREILERYGVRPMESVGKPFDPKYQEAIAKVPSADREPNTVMDELEKGYMYQDRLLRPAKVVVSAAAE